jgi:hypothetical protein
VEKHDAPVGRVGPEQRRADRFGDPEADRAADERAEQVGDLGGPKGRVRIVAYVTASTNSPRTTRNQGMGTFYSPGGRGAGCGVRDAGCGMRDC